MPHWFWSSPDESQAQCLKPINLGLFLPCFMNAPLEKQAPRSSSGHQFTFPITAAPKRSKAETESFLFPQGKGICPELLCYLLLSLMRHKRRRWWLSPPSLGFGHSLGYFHRLESAVVIQELNLHSGTHTANPGRGDVLPSHPSESSLAHLRGCLARHTH